MASADALRSSSIVQRFRSVSASSPPWPAASGCGGKHSRSNSVTCVESPSSSGSTHSRSNRFLSRCAGFVSCRSAGPWLSMPPASSGRKPTRWSCLRLASAFRSATSLRSHTPRTTNGSRATTRYFAHKLPIFLKGRAADGPLRRARPRTRHRLVREVSRRSRQAAAPAAGVGGRARRPTRRREPRGLPRGPCALRQRRALALHLRPDEAARYFALRRSVERNDLAALSVSDLNYRPRGAAALHWPGLRSALRAVAGERRLRACDGWHPVNCAPAPCLHRRVAIPLRAVWRPPGGVLMGRQASQHGGLPVGPGVSPGVGPGTSVFRPNGSPKAQTSGSRSGSRSGLRAKGERPPGIRRSSTQPSSRLARPGGSLPLRSHARADLHASADGVRGGASVVAEPVSHPSRRSTDAADQAAHESRPDRAPHLSSAGTESRRARALRALHRRHRRLRAESTD